MELLTQLFDFVRHMDTHLNDLAGQTGLWFYLVLFFVVFCETGLVVTPFLPGDSLLFALGTLCATANSSLNLPAMLVLLILAAILGDAVNYAIGAYLGPRAFKYDNSWLLNKKYLLRAQEFYERYGSKTIILARFVPIVRTFAPFVAGIGRMRYGKFLAYNVVGAVAWVAICLYAGFFFGQVEWVKRNFEVVVVAIILISVLPMAVEMVLGWLRGRSSGRLETVAAATAPAAEEPLHRAG
jgi:membrane-associated protein